ncbi:MAG: hypothetical protein AB8F26_11780 [Phycisphaerales bacterium]
MLIRFRLYLSLALVCAVMHCVASGQTSADDSRNDESLRRLRERVSPIARQMLPDPERGSAFELLWETELTDFFGQLIFEGHLNVLGEFVHTDDAGVTVLDVTSITAPPAGTTRALQIAPLPGQTQQSCYSVDSSLDGAIVATFTSFFPDSSSTSRVGFFPAGASSPSWTQSIPGRSYEIRFTPDGDILAIGNLGSASGSFAMLMDPFFGGVVWYREFSGVGIFQSEFGTPTSDFDAAGNVLVSATQNLQFAVRRLDLSTGFDSWDAFSIDVPSFPFRQKVRVGRKTGHTFAGFTPNDRAGVQVICLGDDGGLLWDFELTDTGSGGELEFLDLAVALDESCYILYYDDKVPAICKISGDGSTPDNQPVWTLEAPDIVNGVPINFGQVITGDFPGVYFYVPRGGAPWIGRIDEEDGTLLWEHDAPADVTYTLPSILTVDGGGSVFSGGDESGTNSDYVLRKFSQPTPDDPTIQTAHPNLVLGDQSIWAPGINQVSTSGSLGGELPIDFDEGFSAGGYFNTFLLGEFGGSIDFDIDSEFDLGYRAEASGGSVDIKLPLDIEWTIPAPNDIGIDPKNPDAPIIVQIETAFEYNDAAEMTTCFTPYYNAGLTGSFDAGIEFSMSATAFSQTLFDEIIVNESVSVDEGYIPFLSVQYIFDYLGYPPDGDWLTQAYVWGNVTARYPVITAQASLVNGEMQTGEIRDNFFRSRSNLTELLMSIFYPGLSPLNQQGSGSKYGINGSFDYGALQFILGLDFESTQSFGLTDITPRVRYEIRDNAGDTPFATVVQDLGDPLVFELPADSDAHVTPFVFAEAQFNNRTALALVPKLIFEVLSFAASFGFSSWQLFDIDKCFFCDEVGLGDIFNFTLYDTDFPLTLSEVEVAPLIVTGATASGPTLIGSSRSVMDMFIYDQTAPTPGAFNVIASRESKSLLYGNDFEPSGNNNTTKAWITHLGRTEELDAVVLNDATMLVDVPNRFRMLPGVARLQVTTGLGTSRMLDLPMQYPTPRLDTVNPGIWAADPDLNVIPVQVIDRNNPLGNNTFIARRDYYRVLRDELWSGFTAGGLSADEYFPCFDFDALPAIPSVLFGGNPLPPYIQPVENGILNARLAPSDFDRPRVVDVVLCTPGPGGGVSETRQFHVAAPRPVTAIIDPPEIEPGGELLPGEDRFELRILGPRHVPTWDGFEEPKFSNFNADTVVLFDGVPVETEFFGSGELRALVPPALVQHPRRVYVTVHTPDNGTEYLERLVDGAGNVVSFEMVPSGGESAPIAFDVRFRQPEIELLTPSVVSALDPAFDLRPLGQEQANLQVLGRNFRDGAVVLVDGVPRPTEYVGRRILKVQLSPEDVATPGVRRIAVLNPGVSGDTSAMAEFVVTPAAGKRLMNHP